MAHRVDITKLAMVQLHAQLAASDLPARLVLQVHEELVAKAAAEALEAVLNLTHETMVRAVALAMPSGGG